LKQQKQPKQHVRTLTLPLSSPTPEEVNQELQSRKNPGANAQWDQFLRSYQHFYGLMRQSMANLIQDSFPDDLPLFVFWAEVRRSVSMDTWKFEKCMEVLQDFTF
jgi:hypothetical protein